MANWNGLVRFPDGTVLHFEYNGCSDYCLPPLRESFEEMEAHWRQPAEREDCTCVEPDHQPVEIVVTSGVYWPGIACQKCRTIVQGVTPPLEPCYDFPDWAKAMGHKKTRPATNN